ncbi:hypothetical protein FSP39_012566 [Pinctada imbricata]|uniref:Uncharacterized protein n=1 Tax=Pinctada imbricata TaxID=66713 RepID=A0AA88YV39_PINIB|nr:hypothetical protein FSP39_012566 [Pinctada imbricata]
MRSSGDVPSEDAKLPFPQKITSGFGRQLHNHPADHANVVAKQILDQVKLHSTDEVQTIPRIYSEEINTLREDEWDDTTRDVAVRLPTFNSVKSVLYRARRNQTPTLPKTPSSHHF